MGRAFEIELNPVYMAEARRRHDDLETAVLDAIPWVLFRLAVAQNPDHLRTALSELDADDRSFHAIVGCEVLGQASARPDVRQWLCDYIVANDPDDGERYQLAVAYSRLGVEARRREAVGEAVGFARRGLEAVADLPPRAVTANLYYNLGVALEITGDVTGALEAYGDAMDIDETLGRTDEAAESRHRIASLTGSR